MLRASGTVDLRIASHLFNNESTDRNGTLSFRNARLLKHLSNQEVIGALQVSKFFVKEQSVVMYLKHHQSCSLTSKVTFEKLRNRKVAFQETTRIDDRCSCNPDEIDKYKFRWDSRIREESAIVVTNRWRSSRFMAPGCFIGLTASTDPIEEVEIGSIDFNVITFSTKSDGKVTAIGASDQDLRTAITRAHIYVVNKSGKVNGIGEKHLQFKKAGVAVDVVGEPGARGPSSGLGYVAGMMSLALGEQFKGCEKMAFTGEVSCNGDVSAVGGIAAKAAAAKASGLAKMFLPADNKDDMKYFGTGKKFKLIYIEHADELIAQLFPKYFKK